MLRSAHCSLMSTYTACLSKMLLTLQIMLSSPKEMNDDFFSWATQNAGTNFKAYIARNVFATRE